jgi:hypothetical protein
MTKRVMRFPTPSPPWSSRGVSLSDSEKAEVLADNLEAQLKQATVPSAPAVTEMADVALRSYFVTPASKLKLTLTSFTKTSEVSRSARLKAQAVFRTGP